MPTKLVQYQFIALAALHNNTYLKCLYFYELCHEAEAKQPH